MSVSNNLLGKTTADCLENLGLGKRLLYAITGNANDIFKSFHYADDDRFTRPLRNVLKHSLWNAQMSARHCKCPYSSAAHILSTSYEFVKSALSRVVP